MISKKQAKKLKKRLERWLNKIALMPKVVPCDNCNRLGVSDVECFDVGYCRRMGIRFLCGSCRFPQYKDTLRTSTRGNVNIRIKHEVADA